MAVKICVEGGTRLVGQFFKAYEEDKYLKPLIIY